LYIDIYIYIGKYIYIYLYVYFYIYIEIYIEIHIYIHISTYQYIGVYIYTYIYINMYAPTTLTNTYTHTLILSEQEQQARRRVFLCGSVWQCVAVCCSVTHTETYAARRRASEASLF